VAAARAIVGGWRLAGRDVCAEEAGEDLDELAVRDGLGLVPFAVDVHATQWGTLTRLVHAVGAGLVAEGWAIDEGTALVVDGDAVRVEGLGSAYGVAPREGGVVVSVQP
jgi:cyanophycinase